MQQLCQVLIVFHVFYLFYVILELKMWRGVGVGGFKRGYTVHVIVPVCQLGKRVGGQILQIS